MNRIICAILVALGYIGILAGIGIQWAGLTPWCGEGWQLVVGSIAVLISGIIWYCVAKSAKKIK